MKLLTCGRNVRRSFAAASAVTMLLVATACAAGAGRAGGGEELPGGKFTFVIPYAPGGSVDNLGRPSSTA